MERRNKTKFPPVHPGVHIKEVLEDRQISMNKLSRDIRIPLSRVSLMVNGKRGITADTALRLAKYFGTSPQFWMNLQSNYDLEVAEDIAGVSIAREVVPAA